MNTAGKIAAWLIVLWILSESSKENSAQELYDEWYSPEEIADELDMDEDDVRDIVWDDDYDDYRDYDY